MRTSSTDIRIEKELFTRKELADKTNMSAQLFNYLVGTGVIPKPTADFSGKRKYYTKSDAQKIIKEFKR